MGDPTRTGRGSGLVVLLVAGLALTACQPVDSGDSEGDTASDQAASSVTSEEVIEMERSVWEALAAGDHATFGDYLADDIRLVGGEGIVEKQDLMSQLEGAAVEAYEVGDFQVDQPGSGVAVVVYRYSETFRPAEADSTTTFEGWATSVWEDRDGTWQVVLHQSSELPPSMEE
ncbi:MAG: nuclear transport factor 2 family protein [Gemmatimonadota bacterium]